MLVPGGIPMSLSTHATPYIPLLEYIKPGIGLAPSLSVFPMPYILPKHSKINGKALAVFFSSCYSCYPHIALLKHINSEIGLAHYPSVFPMLYTLPKYSTIDGQALAVCFPVATHAALIFPSSSISIQE